MAEKLKIKIDQEKCIGCGSCAAIASEVFAMGEDGKSHVKNPTGAPVEKIKEAVSACPVGAITVEEKE